GLRITGVGGHDDPLLAALDVAERDDAVDDRHHDRALRATRLEQFGHARKTAGDVAGLAGRTCDLDERVAGVDRVAVAELKVGVLREGVTAQLGAVRIDDVDVRVQAGALVAQDAHALHAGGVVELGHVRDAFLEAVELNLAAVTRDDQSVVRIPVEQDRAHLDGLAVLDLEDRAVGHDVTDLGDAVFVDQHHFPGTGNHDLLAVAGVDGFDFLQHHVAVPLGLLLRFRGHAGSRTTDVEGAQRQLGTGLADGLGGHDTDGLADVDHAAVGQVAA